jgi:hypothetical protein
MRARELGLAAALVLLLVPATAAGQDADSLRELLKAYRCQVVDRLERIYDTGDPASTRDRFIAVTMPEHRHGYVQCIFYDRQSKVLCEASSGFYLGKPGMPRTLRLAPDAIAALARLGFSTDDSKGNFRVDFDVSNPPDFSALADFILKSLHDGYGARATTNLKFNAPFAPRPTTSCLPVS